MDSWVPGSIESGVMKRREKRKVIDDASRKARAAEE